MLHGRSNRVYVGAADPTAGIYLPREIVGGLRESTRLGNPARRLFNRGARRFGRW